MSAPSVAHCERLHAPAEVERALDAMATGIDARFGGSECVALCVLQGGIIPAGLLLSRMVTPLQLDSIHVSRYRDTTRGGDLEWLARPRVPIADRRVLLIDDIIDEGHSIAAVRDWCAAAGAAEIVTAVLVNKRHARKHPQAQADFVGLEVPDRYVFGYGMDYRGYHRNAPGIFAVDD